MESLKLKFQKDKPFYKRALFMAWPSVLESFFISLAGMIDTIMVSALGPYAISAVGLTVQPKYIALISFFAINTAISALVARRKGENDRKKANEVFVTAFILTMILNIIISIAFYIWAEPLISLAGSNSDTHVPAVQYFRIIIGGQIFNITAMVINAAQRGCGNTKIAFITNLISSIVNIIFNYLLIEGNLGFPALGVQGAAIATVLGTVVASILSFLSITKKDSLINISYILSKKVKARFEQLKSIFKLSFTIFIENLATRIGFIATAITAASLGTNNFAVHNAAMQFLSLSFSFGDGMQIAAVALTGRSLGENNREKAFKYAHICQRIGFAISLILSLIYWIFGEQFMGMFFDDPDIIATGQILMDFITLTLILQVSQVIYSSALRSGGDVKYTLFASIISVTFIRTIVTLVTVHIFKMGIIGIWIGIVSDQVVRYILMKARFKKGIWTRIKI